MDISKMRRRTLTDEQVHAERQRLRLHELAGDVKILREAEALGMLDEAQCAELRKFEAVLAENGPLIRPSESC